MTKEFKTNYSIPTLSAAPLLYPPPFKSTKTSLSNSDKTVKSSQKISLIIKEKIDMIKDIFSRIRLKLCMLFKASENSKVPATTFKSVSPTGLIEKKRTITSKPESILTVTTSKSTSTNPTISRKTTSISAKTTSTNSSFDDCGLTLSQSLVTSQTPQTTPRRTVGNTYTYAHDNFKKKTPNLSLDDKEKNAISELQATEILIPEEYSQSITRLSPKDTKKLQEILKIEAAIKVIEAIINRNKVIEAIINRKKSNETSETKRIYQGNEYLGLQSTLCRVLERAAFNFLDKLNIRLKPYITIHFTNKKSGTITDKATEKPIKDPIFSYLDIHEKSAASEVLRKRFPIGGSKFNPFSGHMDSSGKPISTTLPKKDWEVIVVALKAKKQKLEDANPQLKKMFKSA